MNQSKEGTRTTSLKSKLRQGLLKLPDLVVIRLITVYCLFFKRCFSSLGITKLLINTDSKFLIQCITEWLPKWQSNGWKISSGGEVKNKPQLVDLYEVKKGIDIKWVGFKRHIFYVTVSDMILLRIMFPVTAGSLAMRERISWPEKVPTK